MQGLEKANFMQMIRDHNASDTVDFKLTTTSSTVQWVTLDSIRAAIADVREQLDNLAHLVNIYGSQPQITYTSNDDNGDSALDKLKREVEELKKEIRQIPSPPVNPWVVPTPWWESPGGQVLA